MLDGETSVQEGDDRFDLTMDSGRGEGLVLTFATWRVEGWLPCRPVLVADVASALALS